MGKTDDCTKNMMEKNTFFADALNCAFYHGETVILPSDLKPYAERKASVKKNADGEIVTEKMFRDVIKKVSGNNVTGLLACIAGVENQTHLSRIMPARIMRYDGTEYVHQGENMARTVEEKLSGMPDDAYLLPVVTAVINFSSSKWTQPRSIHELIYPEYKGSELMKYVPDYFINVIDPYELDDSEIRKMQSGLREIMFTVKYSSDRKKLADIVKSNERFSSLDDETAGFIEYFGKIKLPKNEKGGHDMCKAIQEMKDEVTAAKSEANEAKEKLNDVKEKLNEAKEKLNDANQRLTNVNEKRVNSVRVMLADGLSDELIIKYSGVTLEEINAVRSGAL